MGNLSTVARSGLIKTLEALQAPLTKSGRLMESQIEKTANQISSAVGESDQRHLVVMGGEMRMAAQQILGEMSGDFMVPISIDRVCS